MFRGACAQGRLVGIFQGKLCSGKTTFALQRSEVWSGVAVGQAVKNIFASLNISK
jgi:hypothetical protein